MGSYLLLHFAFIRNIENWTLLKPLEKSRGRDWQREERESERLRGVKGRKLDRPEEKAIEGGVEWEVKK